MNQTYPSLTSMQLFNDLKHNLQLLKTLCSLTAPAISDCVDTCNSHHRIQQYRKLSFQRPLNVYTGYILLGLLRGGCRVNSASVILASSRSCAITISSIIQPLFLPADSTRTLLCTTSVLLHVHTNHKPQCVLRKRLLFANSLKSACWLISNEILLRLYKMFYRLLRVVF